MKPMNDLDEKVSSSLTPTRMLIGSLRLILPVILCAIMAMNGWLGWLGWLVAGTLWVLFRYYHGDSKINKLRMKAGLESIQRLTNHVLILTKKTEIKLDGIESNLGDGKKGDPDPDTPGGEQNYKFN